MELRARRLLSELDQGRASFAADEDEEQRAREETEKMLLICAVRCALPVSQRVLVSCSRAPSRLVRALVRFYHLCSWFQCTPLPW